MTYEILKEAQSCKNEIEELKEMMNNLIRSKQIYFNDEFNYYKDKKLKLDNDELEIIKNILIHRIDRLNILFESL